MDKAAVGKLISKARTLAGQVASDWEARASVLEDRAQGMAQQAAQFRDEAAREREEVEALAKALDCCSDPAKPPCSPCEEARRATEAHVDPAILPPTVTVDTTAPHPVA